MKISVIIPLYNGEKTILRTLESVLNQTYSADEIIIVNDGSTDSSNEILKPFIEQDKIKYFFKQNGGVSSARNYGIKKSKNKWIALIDADDEWDEVFLENIKKYHKKNKLASVICTNYRKSINGGTKRVMQFKKLILNNYDEITNYLESTINKEHPISSSTIVMKKEVLARVDYFPEYMNQAEDLITWYRLSMSNRIGFINKSLVTIHFTENSKNKPKRMPSNPNYFYVELKKISKQSLYSAKLLKKRIRYSIRSRAITFILLKKKRCALKELMILIKDKNFTCVEISLIVSLLIPHKIWLKLINTTSKWK